ncbi:DUF58 domain-containing protein [Flavobacteriaceae bacterium M23B6Z8]
MLNFIRSFYLRKWFFRSLLFIGLLFLVAHWFEEWYNIAWLFVFVFILLFIADLLLVFVPQNPIKATRVLPEKFSNSDSNPVPVSVFNKYGFKIHISIIDELPVQFQKRDFFYSGKIEKHKSHNFEYHLRPVERGIYQFGALHIFISSPLQLVARRFSFQKEQEVAVYPSFIQMKKYDFLAISNKLTAFGFKKIRRIGHTMEFEQIKNYVKGDDYRTINWKATAKHSTLMVNQYQDEKAQPILSMIDTGRVMKMPFEGLKLLDYAINATLAFSNVALKKKDKVGMLSFNKKVSDYVMPSDKLSNLSSIMERLYGIDTQYPDADFGLLYNFLKRKVSHRSLLMLYTNFEHISALKRQLPYLQAIARKHLLVVIFFENTELKKITEQDAEDLQGIYHKTIAEKFDFDKRVMQKELQKHGIQSILTTPEKLSINAINKYLEIKSRGLL